jgi:23S rRNA pseudouridine2605 synthase
MQERLQKIIAHAGYASRREAEAMMREGRITLNGRVVTELGTRADPDRDHIKVDGKLITRAEDHRYILLYKPKEVMTTVEDPQGRRTVIDLVRGVRERIYPVGRLDYHSEGLVLLTNDGELAYKISHPTHGSVKTYNVSSTSCAAGSPSRESARSPAASPRSRRPAGTPKRGTVGGR